MNHAELIGKTITWSEDRGILSSRRSYDFKGEVVSTGIDGVMVKITHAPNTEIDGIVQERTIDYWFGHKTHMYLKFEEIYKVE
jgi:uncharacterized protein YcnI